MTSEERRGLFAGIVGEENARDVNALLESKLLLKDQKAGTTLDRDQLRTQLRDAVKDQALDRVQLRDRLQTLRESLPSHDQLVAQAREQVQAGARRGE